MLSALESVDRRTLAVGGLALAAVLVLALHVFSQLAFRGVQIDLTEDSVYTLSQGTREVLAAVKEPVTLRFFVSPELVEQSPGLNN